MLRKIARMHSLFGESKGNKCKDCCHFHREQYRGRYYRKCLIYGDTQSETSDWAGKYDACGLYNKLYGGDIEIISIRPSKEPDEPLEGQISIFDL